MAAMNFMTGKGYTFSQNQTPEGRVARAESLNNYTYKIGRLFNNLSGVTQQQDWQKAMRDSSILSTADQYEALGLNPSLLYGQGASAASTPSGPSGGGRVNIPSIDGLVNSASNLINSQTRAYQVDRYNKHLDWKEKDQIDRTVIEIFDKLGDLVMSQARTKTSKR